jgi:alpha/beta superfamily hydrolase
METPIVAEIAYQVTRAGHPTLRFNYRGVGASAGTFDEANALQDARSALQHLVLSTKGEAEEGVPEIALLGVGYGAEIALRLALESEAPVAVLVLISPDPSRIASDMDRLDTELVVIAAELDARRDALRACVDRCRRGRLAVIPRADRAFVRGLVELGRVAKEAISPPGMIDLG